MKKFVFYKNSFKTDFLFRIKKANFKGKTNLKRIENHRLEELIFQDVKIYGPTPLRDIRTRIAPELSYDKIRKTIYKMIDKGIIEKVGVGNSTKYLLGKNG